MKSDQVEQIMCDDVKLSLINLRILALNIQIDTVEELLNSGELEPDDILRATDAVKEYTEILSQLKLQRAKVLNRQTKEEVSK